MSLIKLITRLGIFLGKKPYKTNKMAYIDDFRALASVAINQEIDEHLRKKATSVMYKIVDIMGKAADVEDAQIEDFLSKIKSKIEVIKQ